MFEKLLQNMQSRRAVVPAIMAFILVALNEQFKLEFAATDVTNLGLMIGSWIMAESTNSSRAAGMTALQSIVNSPRFWVLSSSLVVYVAVTKYKLPIPPEWLTPEALQRFVMMLTGLTNFVSMRDHISEEPK